MAILSDHFSFMKKRLKIVVSSDSRRSLAEMLVLGEQVVEDPKSGLEVQVDDVLGPGLGLGQPGVLHQLKGQGHVRSLLVKRLKLRGKHEN